MRKRPSSPAACLAPSFFYLSVLLAGFFLTAGSLWAAGIKLELLTISGEVSSQAVTTGPVVIEVYDRPQLAPRPVYSTTIPGPGPFEVRVHPGTYYLRAFVDENRNQTWDPGEPIGLYAAPSRAGATQPESKEAPTVQALIVLPLAPIKGIHINIEVDTSKK